MMPGFLGGNKAGAAAGGVPPGMNIKNALIQAAPLFASMAAGYSSGRGPFAYMDQGIAGIQANQKAKRDEEAAAAASAAFGGLMRPGGMGAAGGGGGGLPIATAPRNPNDPTSISGDTMTALGKDGGTAGYRASLIGTESGGNWKAQNSEMGAGGKAGHFGRVQFGQARLQEAMNAGAIPQGTTPEQFMNSPALQIAAENWHFGDLEGQLGDLVGREVNGKVMDLPALVAMGHLGGAGGARKYVESGGAYNPSDSFGTSLADYATTHGGTGGAAPAGPVDPMSDPYVQQLMTVMSMPGITPEQQAVVQMQLQSRIQTITTPPAGAEEEAARAMRARDAETLGYTRGSPEWNQYVITGEQPVAATPVELKTFTGPDGTVYSFNPVTNETKPLTGAEAAPKPMTPDERAAWGIPATDVTPYVLVDGMPKPISAGGTTINNDMGGTGKQVYDTIAASADKASTAAVGLNSLAEAKKALDGGAITGFAADQRLYLQKLGSYLGISDPAAIENTETFRAAIAPQVSAMIKATVGSANISNSDREFAEKAAAGSISLDENSIKRMIGIMDKMGTESIKMHNKKVNDVYPEGQGFDRERALFLIPEPIAAPSAGGDDGVPTFNPQTGEWE